MGNDVVVVVAIVAGLASNGSKLTLTVVGNDVAGGLIACGDDSNACNDIMLGSYDEENSSVDNVGSVTMATSCSDKLSWVDNVGNGFDSAFINSNFLNLINR